MGEVRVSVVVPVRDRRDLLAKLLDGLAAQTFRDFEVVVVDDGSTDGSAEVARAETRVATTVVSLPGRGAVAARQAGVAVARGDVLAFTDSDCVPAPQWLHEGVTAIDAGADVVMGRTRSQRPRRVLERSLTAEDNGLYPTCNVFYRRAAFEQAHGFDVHLSHRLGFRAGGAAKHLGFGEDTLLGWRVGRAGRAAYAPDAVVEHAVFRPDLKDHFSRTLQAGAFPALVKEIPELRATLLNRRVFLGPTSRVPFYFALVALVLRRPAFAFVLTLWWMLAHWRALSEREPSFKRRVLAWPIVVATDGVTGVVLLAGSARSASLVL
ncbi:MAG: hypothetical protein QOJ00_2820 [Actinomycetota bacterium]|jgi:glycosyltransferase involved in cell wall biosynthesis